MADETRVPNKDWDPEAALQSLAFEAQMEQGDAAAASARLLREHAIMATQSICHLAAFAVTERIRFEAARYVVDRVLESSLDHDVRLQRAQTKVVGQALYTVVRALGLQHGFDPDSQEVRELAHDAILTFAIEEEGGA